MTTCASRTNVELPITVKVRVALVVIPSIVIPHFNSNGLTGLTEAMNDRRRSRHHHRLPSSPPQRPSSPSYTSYNVAGNRGARKDIHKNVSFQALTTCDHRHCAYERSSPFIACIAINVHTCPHIDRWVTICVTPTSLYPSATRAMTEGLKYRQ